MTNDSPPKDGLQDRIGDTDLESTEARPPTTTAAMSSSQSRPRRSPPPRSPPPRDRYRGRDRSDWKGRDYRTRSPPPRDYPRGPPPGSRDRGGRYERSRDWDRDRDRNRDRDRGRRYDDYYDPPPRRPPGSPPRGYRSPRPRRSSHRSPSPPPRGGPYIASRMSDGPTSRGGRDDRYSHRRSRSPPPRRSPSPRYRRPPSPRPYRRGTSRSSPPPSRHSRRPSSRQRTRSPPPRRRSPPPHAASSNRVRSHSRSTSEVGAGAEGREASGAPPPASSKEEGSSPVKEEPVQVKEESFDGPMDLDRATLPSASVKRERSASPVKAQPSSPERNHETSSSSGAGPSFDRPHPTQHAYERRLPPTGPRGARTREGERSPSRSVKAESPAFPSVHKLKQEPSPYHWQNDGSMSPAVTSPHPNHHHAPTGFSNRTGKPIPSGPRAANRAAVPPLHAAPAKTEPEKPKVKDIEIPNRRRDWSYLPGQKEHELLSQKLLVQQKALQDLALEVIRSGWDLDVHAVELEGLKEKREVAEKMFERASQGLTQDEAVDQNPAAQLKPSRSGSAAPSKAPSTGATN